MQAPQYSADGRFWWNGYQWVPVAPMAAPPPPAWAYRKSAAPYVVASVFIPGLGSLLLQRWKWGVPILAAVVAVWVTLIIVFTTSVSGFAQDIQQCTPECPPGALHFPSGIFITMAVAWPVGLVAWILGIVDAVRGTNAWNRAQGLPE